MLRADCQTALDYIHTNPVRSERSDGNLSILKQLIKKKTGLHCFLSVSKQQNC